MNRPLLKKWQFQSLGAFLALVLSAQTVAIPLAQAASLPTPALPGSPQTLQKTTDAASVRDIQYKGVGLAIPAKLGEIVEAKASAKEGRLIIHIQDVHEHVPSQTNLSQMITLLDGEAEKAGKSLVVAVEGESKKYDASVVAAYPDQKKKDQVADGLLKSGFFFGEDHAAVKADPGRIHIVGVETPSLYLANKMAKLNSLESRERMTGKLTELGRQLEILKQNNFNKTLQTLEAYRLAFEKGEVSLDRYLSYLDQLDGGIKAVSPEIARVLTLSQMEAALDFSLIEKETRMAISQALYKKEAQSKQLARQAKAVEEGRLSPLAFYSALTGNDKSFPALAHYLAYLKEAEKTNPEKLFEEIRAAEFSLAENLVQHPVAAELYRHVRWVETQRRLYGLELIPAEWRREKGASLDETYVRYQRIRDFVAEQTQALGYAFSAPTFSLSQLKNAFKGAQGFYAAAESRDAVMVKNLEKALTDYPEDNFDVVFVAGGFHTEGITKELSKRGLSYVVIRPRIETDIRLSTEYQFPEPGSLIQSLELLQAQANQFRPASPAKTAGFSSVLTLMGLAKPGPNEDLGKTVSAKVQYPTLGQFLNPRSGLISINGTLWVLSLALLTASVSIVSFFIGRFSIRENEDDSPSKGKQPLLKKPTQPLVSINETTPKWTSVAFDLDESILRVELDSEGVVEFNLNEGEVELKSIADALEIPESHGFNETVVLIQKESNEGNPFIVFHDQNTVIKFRASQGKLVSSRRFPSARLIPEARNREEILDRFDHFWARFSPKPSEGSLNYSESNLNPLDLDWQDALVSPDGKTALLLEGKEAYLKINEGNREKIYWVTRALGDQAERVTGVPSFYSDGEAAITQENDGYVFWRKNEKGLFELSGAFTLDNRPNQILGSQTVSAVSDDGTSLYLQVDGEIERFSLSPEWRLPSERVISNRRPSNPSQESRIIYSEEQEAILVVRSNHIEVQKRIHGIFEGPQFETVLEFGKEEPELFEALQAVTSFSSDEDGFHITSGENRLTLAPLDESAFRVTDSSLDSSLFDALGNQKESALIYASQDAVTLIYKSEDGRVVEFDLTAQIGDRIEEPLGLAYLSDDDDIFTRLSGSELVIWEEEDGAYMPKGLESSDFVPDELSPAINIQGNWALVSIGRTLERVDLDLTPERFDADHGETVADSLFDFARASSDDLEEEESSGTGDEEDDDHVENPTDQLFDPDLGQPISAPFLGVSGLAFFGFGIFLFSVQSGNALSGLAAIFMAIALSVPGFLAALIISNHEGEGEINLSDLTENGFNAAFAQETNEFIQSLRTSRPILSIGAEEGIFAESNVRQNKLSLGQGFFEEEGFETPRRFLIALAIAHELGHFSRFQLAFHSKPNDSALTHSVNLTKWLINEVLAWALTIPNLFRVATFAFGIQKRQPPVDGFGSGQVSDILTNPVDQANEFQDGVEKALTPIIRKNVAGTSYGLLNLDDLFATGDYASVPEFIQVLTESFALDQVLHGRVQTEREAVLALVTSNDELRGQLEAQFRNLAQNAKEKLGYQLVIGGLDTSETQGAVDIFAGLGFQDVSVQDTFYIGANASLVQASKTFAARNLPHASFIRYAATHFSEAELALKSLIDLFQTAFGQDITLNLNQRLEAEILAAIMA